jgi:magnesium chelatase subunit D
MPLTHPQYPFAALVGLDQLKTALLLNAIHPAIGGVLIRGERGTAKSTAARALRDILSAVSAVEGCPYHCDPRSVWLECPHCGALAERTPKELPVPFVDLPLGATEDRVLGTLDFERALRESRRAFQPGLLAEAHRGILYIDEVNLLADHLVDILLDAAAMGVNTVEREGVAVTHPARFILIGTMNPEEGDLRPQLLDRFGLMVVVAGPRDPDTRTLVVRRRLDYEQDPAAFHAAWQNEQQVLRAQIQAGQKLVPNVKMDAGLVSFISRLCCEMEVDGLRADLVMNKTARALAAWQGRLQVTLDDIRAAAELALPHRRRRKPFEKPGLDRERLDQLFGEQTQPSSASDPGRRPESHIPPEPAPQFSDAGDQTGVEDNGSRVFPAASTTAAGRIEVVPSPAAHGSAPGRRNLAGEQRSGHYTRAVPGYSAGDVAVDATVRAAARRGIGSDGRLDIQPVDIHHKHREGKIGTLILFVVDASGSMAARRRMEAVKGAVLSLLHSAYEKRDQVGVIALRGVAAQVLLAPTRSVDTAEQALRQLPTGGRTPLAHALCLAHELLAKARQSHPASPVLLIALTDGKANVPLSGTQGDPWHQSLEAAARLASAGTPALVLDSETGFVRLGRARQLAQALAAEHLALEELSAQDLVFKIQQMS